MKCSACAICGNVYEMENALTSYLGKLSNGNYVIIENVPCFRCPNCGEEYFAFSTSEKIEKIIDTFENSCDRVCITSFDTAA